MSYHRRYKPRDFDFAQRLLTLRKRASLTQEEVALRVGVTEKAIRNWEGGSNHPTEANLRKLIELYLNNRAFAPGQEYDEARQLWEQLRESTHRHGNSFDVGSAEINSDGGHNFQIHLIVLFSSCNSNPPLDFRNTRRSTHSSANRSSPK